MQEKITRITNKQPRRQYLAEHLANERTHLAWLRTSFAVIVLGIAINRFSRFIVESEELSGVRSERAFLVDERRLGFGLVVFGMLLIVWSAIRYTRISSDIDQGQYRPATFAAWVI